MARIYGGRKGKHGSKKPPIKIVPRWLRGKQKEVEELIVRLAKEGKSSAQIGLILRDQYGIPDVKAAIGKKISATIREHSLYPAFPEDLLNLFRKLVNLREHLAQNKADRHSRRALGNLESKIKRLLKYYQREGVVSPDFVYDPEKIKLIVRK